MLQLTQFKEWVQSTGTRIGKVLGIGGTAIQLKEIAPFGVDCNPPKNMMALYAQTPNSKQKYIVGYINKGQLADTGETRLYSVDAGGNLKAYVWNKADGTLELNGDEFSAVRYQNLNTQLQSLITQVNSQLPLIASGIATGGGTYTPTNVSVDFASAESPDVKLK